MLILGIDPGIGRTGWGIIRAVKNDLSVVDYGCIETLAQEDLSRRLFLIYQFLCILLEKYQPEAVSVEELFFNTNAKTALIVGQARGVVLLAAAQKNVTVSVYTPLQVKIAVTGYGRAEKKQVGQMVKVILKLPSIPKPDDTADALAIAITHSFTKKYS